MLKKISAVTEIFRFKKKKNLESKINKLRIDQIHTIFKIIS